MTDHAGRLAGLAAEQRDNAARLLAAVRDAADAGMTWREIGEALDVPHVTVFRQVKAGSPVVVARPTHDPARVVSTP